MGKMSAIQSVVVRALMDFRYFAYHDASKSSDVNQKATETHDLSFYLLSRE